MKIAIISDIHGNIQALEAVMQNIKQEKCEKIFCLGDLAMAGPEPSKTIDKIKELQKTTDFILIQGNTDEMIANCDNQILHMLKENNPIMANALQSDIQEISEEQKLFLRNLPKQKETEIEGLKILLVHGSPRKNNENIYPDLKIEEVEEMISQTDADIIFCGHTHMPCGYQTNTKQTVVNVGSIGRPFSEEPKSCYAVLEINNKEFSIKHNFINYDFKTAAEILKERGFDGADKLAQMLIHATSRYPQ
ncbi:MAG: metallophosphoesterase family protein [Clostridium sp.]|nr:metallophosphoesterase family protein [Clostridium sp.]